MEKRTARSTAAISVVFAIILSAAAIAGALSNATAFAEEPSAQPTTKVILGGETVILPGESHSGISVSADGKTITFENADLTMPKTSEANSVVRAESSVPDLVVSFVGQNSIQCDKQGAMGLHLLAECENSSVIPQYRLVGPGSLRIDVMGHGIYAANYNGPHLNLTVTDSASLDIECLLDSAPTPDIAYAGNAIQVAYGGFFVSNGAHIKAVSDAVDTINIGSADKSDEPLTWLRIESGAVLDLENRFACKIEDGLGIVESSCLFYLGDHAVIDNATVNMSSPTKMAYTTNGLMTTYAEMSIQNSAVVRYRTPAWEDYQGQGVDITAMHGLIVPRLTIDNATVDVLIDLTNEPEAIKRAYAVGIAYAWYLDILNGARVKLDVTSDTACGIHWKGNTARFTNGDIRINASRVDVNAVSLTDNLRDTNAVFGIFTHTLSVNTVSADQGLFVQGSIADTNAEFIALAAYWGNTTQKLPFDPSYTPQAVSLGADTGITAPEKGLCSRYSVLWYGDDEPENVSSGALILEESEIRKAASENDFFDRSSLFGVDAETNTVQQNPVEDMVKSPLQDAQANGGQWGSIDTIFDPSNTEKPAAACAISYTGASPSPSPTPDPEPSPSTDPSETGSPSLTTGDCTATLAVCLLACAAGSLGLAALSARRRQNRQR